MLSLRSILGQEQRYLLGLHYPGQEREFPIHRKELDQTPILGQEHNRTRGWPSCRASISAIVAPVDLLKAFLFRKGHRRPPGLACAWVGELQRVQDLALLARLIGHVIDSHHSVFL